jgi:hypothetical protein
MPPPHIRTTDALPPEDQRLTDLRFMVVAIGNRMLEEIEARRRLAQEVNQLRAEVSQTRAAVRTAGRR